MERPEAPPAPASSGSVPPRQGWLAAFYDPEWVLFFAVLLLPALLFVLLRDPLKARFFAGAAIYIAVLKWIGWAVLGRKSRSDLSYLLFPAELFAGLAVVCAWFYLRNHLARLWPASYSLGEFSLLIYMLVPVHVLQFLIHCRARIEIVGLGRRLALFVPFIVCLTIALWKVSGLLGVLGTDSIHYVFSARVFLDHGLDFAIPPLGRTLSYPCALSGMTAAAAAIAPLSVVQAFHLQHVIFCIASLFLVTTTLGTVVQRPLSLLHSFPLPFLAVFPLYALYPDILYPGVPKQLGPPLCAAVCLLPLAVPVIRLRDRYVLVGISALLIAVIADLNPACVPYALISALLVLIVNYRFDRTMATGTSARYFVGFQVCAGLLAGLVILSADPFYRKLATDSLRPTEKSKDAGDPGIKAPAFSSAKAVRQLTGVSPFRLSRTSSTTAFEYVLPSSDGWPEQWPQAMLPIAALLLTGIYVLSCFVSRGRIRRVSVPGALALTCLLLSVGIKYFITFVAGGIERINWQGYLLDIYLRYLLIRCELLLLFTCSMAAGVWLFVELPRGQGLAPVARWLVSILTVAVCWALPFLCIVLDAKLSGTVQIPINQRYPVTSQDLDLVAWADANLSADEALIGLAADPFETGFNGEEKHIYPLKSGVAFGFYSKRYNVRFLMPALENIDVVQDYRNHIRDRFDAAWCLRNRIRYFYVPTAALEKNPGLENAIDRGFLRSIRSTQSASLYEVIAPEHADPIKKKGEGNGLNQGIRD